jgi:type 1 fimbriae regulatory protein FimB/type 1 fimbriae regulatory protein FimE
MFGKPSTPGSSSRAATCGRYKLSSDGDGTRAIQHYLGHRNTQRAVRHTEQAPTRFKDFWRD